MILVYLADGPLFTDGAGRLGVYAKSLSGLAAYRAHWPGDVYVSSFETPEQVEAGRSGVAWQDDPRALGLRFLAGVSLGDLHELGPSVVLHSVHGKASRDLLGASFASVLTDDWSPEVRLEVALVSATGPMDRLRIRAGHLRRTRRIDSIARDADAFQCNGHDAGRHYQMINTNTLPYFDHRIRQVDLLRGASRDFWDGGRALRLAYSGRLTRMKGVHLIPALLDQFESAGIPFEFHLIGLGEDEQDLREAMQGRAHFHGFMDFEKDWKSFVRENVDLMFLPHLQGDSASTYFEALGCGVPLLGFVNRTLSPLLAASHAGWEVPLGDVAAATGVVKSILEDPAKLRSAAERGLEFMNSHTFETEFKRRVEHMLAVARTGQ